MNNTLQLKQAMDLWNYTTPTMPPIPDYNEGQIPPTAATNPLFKNITFALQVILFIICLTENSITVFILHKNITNGRQTFAQFMLINITCVDISTAVIYYSATFVQFSHGRFVWLVQGVAGDILCKLYNFLLNFPEKILILSLVALACDAARNSSLKGRKEHSKMFSIIVSVLFWMTGAGFSAIYLGISKVQPSSQTYECSTEPDSQMTVMMLNLIHSFGFVATADLILTIVSLVVFVRVRRRGKELKRHRQVTGKGKKHTKMGRQRKVDVKKINHQLPLSADEVDQEMQPTTSHETSADHTEISQQSGASHIGCVVLTEMSSTRGNENILGNNEATVTNTNPSAISEGNKSQAKRKGGKKQQLNGRNDVEARGAINGAGQADKEERFKATRKEAKIMGVVSSLFVIISLTQLILRMVCPSCSVYLFFAVQIAAEIYAVIKPGIYACIDKEFRKKYKQLSPFAGCCVRRIRCHTVQQVRIAN